VLGRHQDSSGGSRSRAGDGGERDAAPAVRMASTLRVYCSGDCGRGGCGGRADAAAGPPPKPAELPQVGENSRRVDAVVAMTESFLAGDEAAVRGRRVRGPAVGCRRGRMNECRSCWNLDLALIE